MVAALLGADEVSFGTALLLAEGCLMVRSCHLDTCPVGIATQRPELRAKFAATPEQVEAYLRFVAEEVRAHLARLGLRTFDEAVGRADLLRRAAGDAARLARLDAAPRGAAAAATRREPQLHAPAASSANCSRTTRARARRGALVDLRYPICNARPRRRRAARRRDRPRFGDGASARPHPRRASPAAAGQSFGAFLTAGVELELDGEANDYVGKGMAGGRIVVRAPADDAGDPVLSATRSSTARPAASSSSPVARVSASPCATRARVAVVEGVGDHGCEYMTGGRSSSSARSANFGAGMSGGELYVFDAELLERRRNQDVVLRAATVDELLGVRELVERHERATRSSRSADVLARWDEVATRFVRVAPRSAVVATAESTG